MVRTFLFGFVCATALAVPAFGQEANLLGAFGNWTAYTSGSGDNITCFAMSRPRAIEPKAGAKRSAAYLIVTDYPARRVKAEPEIVPGYEYRDKAPVTLEIGDDKFAFFGRNQAKSGNAWLLSLADGERLIEVMKNGVSAVAMGTSSRGTKTTDTYALAGFNDALAKIHAACSM